MTIWHISAIESSLNSWCEIWDPGKTYVDDLKTLDVIRYSTHLFGNAMMQTSNSVHGNKYSCSNDNNNNNGLTRIFLFLFCGGVSKICTYEVWHFMTQHPKFWILWKLLLWYRICRAFLQLDFRAWVISHFILLFVEHFFSKMGHFTSQSVLPGKYVTLLDVPTCCLFFYSTGLKIIIFNYF